MPVPDCLTLSLHRQVSCGAGALPDFTLTRMLTPGADGCCGRPGQLACLSLRLPGSRLALGQLQALRRLSGLRSLYLDILPPAEVGGWVLAGCLGTDILAGAAGKPWPCKGPRSNGRACLCSNFTARSPAQHAPPVLHYLS